MEKSYLTQKIAIVSRLRDLLEGMPLEHSSFFIDGPVRCTPRDVRLPGETQIDSIVFPAYRNAASCDLYWSTEDRLAFADTQDRIVASVSDLPVSIRFEDGWRWAFGEESGRPEGRSRRVRSFQLRFSITDETSEEKTAYVPVKVCQSLDARADRCLFELIEDAGIHIADMIYHHTDTGFRTEFVHHHHLDAVRDLFHDCACVVSHLEEGWSMDIIFPWRSSSTRLDV